MDVRVSGIFEEFSDKIRRAFESDGLTGGCLLRGGHRAGVEIVEVGGRDVVASGRLVRSGYIRTNAVRGYSAIPRIRPNWFLNWSEAPAPRD